MPDSRKEQFNALIRPHLPVLYRVAWRLVRNRADAEDLVQDTCVAACRNLDGLAAADSPVRWLLRVQQNRFIDGRRRNQASPLVAVEDTTELLGERARALNDARAFAMLEKLSASDADPGVREVATAVLKAEPSAPPAGRPQRLGVNLSVMQADADVAGDMVGRPMVVGVGAGTLAQKAGVMNGDVLLEINGMPVPGGVEIIKLVESLPTGVDVDVLVQRSGQKVRLVARF